MGKSYITKKNIGKIKSKNTRLGKSKKNSRKKKQNKIHKILKQNGGANGVPLSEVKFKEEIDYRYQMCNTKALRDIWPILIFFRKRSRINETMKQVPGQENYFKLNIESNIFFERLKPKIFENIEPVYIGLILELVDVTLRELRMKIEFCEKCLAHSGDVLLDTPEKRVPEYNKINNLYKGLLEKKNYRKSPFLDRSEKPDKSNITEVITYLKKNQALYDENRNNMIINFVYEQAQKK